MISLAQTIGLDSAVAFSVTARLWQLIGATGTVVLMSKFFSEEVQGFYYTMVSLLAAQAFLDLGLGGIIVLLASHEWAHLARENGLIAGSDKSRGRLAEIYRFGCRWYFYSATAFLVLIAPIGIYLLADDGNWFEQNWLAPWIICVVLNAASMTLLPRISLLEGCNQVVAVNRMRLSQSVVGSIFVWISMASGLGLWTLVVSNLVRLLWEWKIVHGEYGPMLRQLGSAADDNHLDWKTEIWPLQWRLAIQSICGYFATWFIVPVTFRFHGEVLAGKIGLTWQLLTTIQAASLAWVQTRLPRFGSLLASKNHKQLDSQMFRTSLISLGVFIGGLAAFFLALHGAEFVGLSLASRFISTSSILFFAGGLLGWNLCTAEQSYVRLFKKDPFLLISVLSSCLVGSATWYFGSRSGPSGVSIAFCTIAWLYAIPVSTFILLKHRRELESQT